MIHARTRLNTAVAHQFVEDLGVHLVHAPLLLEALDGNLDALDERLILIVHSILLLGFGGRHRWLDVGVFETGRLLHILRCALGIDLLLLRMKLDLIYSSLAGARIVGNPIPLLAEVFVQKCFALQRDFALDRLSICRYLEKRAIAQCSNHEGPGLVRPHFLETADATGRHWNVLASAALLQKMEICRKVLVGEVVLDLVNVSCYMISLRVIRDSPVDELSRLLGGRLGQLQPLPSPAPTALGLC